MQQIVVDWGSSCLRSFLLDSKGKLLASRQSADGIFSLQPGRFAAAIKQQCSDWLPDSNLMLMAGMVGSRSGWCEVPYLPCPVDLAALATACMPLPEALSDAALPDIRLVPGLSCQNNGIADVMRGEETQIFGALQLTGLDNAWLCLPGTHSKWARVQQGFVTHFHSFLTGELFALLKAHSSLAAFCQQQPTEPSTTEPAATEHIFLNHPAFEQGVQQAAAPHSNLLQQLFSVRAQVLAGQLPQQHASAFLSGLLIGHELNSAKIWLKDNTPLLLVGNRQLNALYQQAAAMLGMASQHISAEDASLAGFNAILQQLHLQA
jgi:2-dehydro-3-deoxygalactonokinase